MSFYATSDDFNDLIISRFLYGLDETPERIAEDDFIGRPQPPAAGQTFDENFIVKQIEATQLMLGFVRFGLPRAANDNVPTVQSLAA